MRPLTRFILLIAAALLLLFFLVQQQQQQSPNSDRQRQQNEKIGGKQTSAVNNILPNDSSSWFGVLINRLLGRSSQEEDGRFLPVAQGYLNHRSFQESELKFTNDYLNASQRTADRDWVSISTEGASDLLADKMGNKSADGQQESADMKTAGLRCNSNKYDRLIAQEISKNGLSRPVITSSGRFNNPFPTWNQASLVGVVQFMLEPSEANLPSNRDELEKELPLLRPNFEARNQANTEFRVTWIGHSTLLIQVDGFNILTDPIFSERASFSQYIGPKRIREPACDIKSLPRIDIVLISHNHYDHLDSDSVRQLNDRFGINCRWIVPLGLGEFLRSMYVHNYVELDWWQKDCFFAGTKKPEHSENNDQELSSAKAATTTNKEISDKINNSPETMRVNKKMINGETGQNNRLEIDIYLTPSQHWSRRWIADTNKSLWGSYTIVSKSGSTFFFAGDSGYCSAFKEIGKIFGPFAGAAIPIGAYKPRWFLKAQHVDPHEAVQVHKDLRSKKSIAIHHSTFLLSNEGYREPAMLLREIMHEHKMNGTLGEPFIVLKHGESAVFCGAC